MNDVGCTNVGLMTTSGGQTGISVDTAKYVYINNPNINNTLHINVNPSSGIRVNDQEALVWVNGGVLQNLAGEGVRVDDSTLFHMPGTQVIGANNQGIVVGQSHGETSDIQLTNVLVRDVSKTSTLYRAVDLEGLIGSVDVRTVTIQDGQTPPSGYVFFTGDLHRARGIIDGVSGYIPNGSLAFSFQLDMAGDPETMF